MGLLSCLGFRSRRPVPSTIPPANDDTPAESPPTTPWTVYRDGNGNRIWQNDITKQWTYNDPHSTNKQVEIIVVPAPQQQFPQQQQFPPPPVGCPLAPVIVFPEAKKKDGKKKGGTEKNKAKGTKGKWQEFYADDGTKLWKHSGTKRVTHTDPYQ